MGTARLHIAKRGAAADIQQLFDIFEVTGPVRMTADGVVVEGDCYPRSGVRCSELPVWFARVEGIFDCAGLGLTTLTGAPAIVRYDLLCQDNALTDLSVGQDRPLLVGGDLRAERNPLDFGKPPATEGSSIGRLSCSMPQGADGLSTFTQILQDEAHGWHAPPTIRDALMIAYRSDLPLLRFGGKAAAEAFLMGRIDLRGASDKVNAILREGAQRAHASPNWALMQMQSKLVRANSRGNARW